MKKYILINGYNCEDYATQCLDSVVSQMDNNTEIVVLDDHSTDGTFNILSKYVGKITLLQNVERKGAAYSRWRLLHSIKPKENDVIILVDLDDYLEDNAVFFIENLYKNNSILDATYGGCFFHGTKIEKEGKDYNGNKEYVGVHLRTFRAWHIAFLNEELFKLDGEWLQMTTDVPLMYQILHNSRSWYNCKGHHLYNYRSKIKGHSVCFDVQKSEINKKVNKKIHTHFITKGRKITVGMATFANRNYTKTLNSLLNQTIEFDDLFIYNNEKLPDLKSYGKFYKIENNQDIYITVDDDIIYPSDHLERLVLGLEKNPFVTMHGRILDGDINSYYNGGHTYFLFRKENKEYKYIDVAGTGVSAYDCKRIDFSNFYKFIEKWNCQNDDLTMSLFVKNQGFKPLIIPHQPMTSIFNNNGIFHTYNNNDEVFIPILKDFLK